MEACNHSTFSQAIIQTVTEVGVQYDQVVAIVSDSAAYCKKAYRDVLSAIFPNSMHVLCLAHIVNLVAEVFHHHHHFTHTNNLVMMIKSSLFKKPAKKSRFLKFLGDYIPSSEVKLLPEPVSTRWNSWFSAVIYHATRVHLYEGFYKAESSKGMAVERIIELVTHRELYPEICLHLYFIKENCQRIMSVLTSLENKAPLASTVYMFLEDLAAYLETGSEKESFGSETDRLLAKLPRQEREEQIKAFQEVFAIAHKKLKGHLQSHPAHAFYEAARIFDPRQLPTISQDIDKAKQTTLLVSRHRPRAQKIPAY